MNKITKSRYFTISNEKGLKAVLSSVGAGVKSLSLNGTPLILELKNPLDYLNSPNFFGKTLCRVAGRIPSKFEIDSETYNVVDTGNSICLHGGELLSPSFKDFESEVESSEKGTKVIFTYDSKDLENGFPGNVILKVTYYIPSSSNEFQIHYEAITDKDTPISFSNHMYFNLNRDKDINSYNLKVKASKMGEFKKGTLLINKRIDVPKYFDFREEDNLGKRIDALVKHQKDIGTLDNTFIFEKKQDKEPQVILENEKIKLETYTDFEALNLYVNNYKFNYDFINRDDFSTRSAIAIEPQNCPYPLNGIILKSNEKYSHYINYKIIEK